MQMLQQAQNAQRTPAIPQSESPDNRSDAVPAPEPSSPPSSRMSPALQTRRNRSTANPIPAMPSQTKPARMAALNASESPVTTIEPIVKPAAEPVKTPLDTANTVTPPVVEFVSLNNDLGEVIRTIKVRINNPSERAVQKIKVTLTYIDASGRKLKEWTTVHQEPDRLVEGKTIREFNCPAFFMPESTKRVDILLREAGFTDGTQWKR
jgi:hypothetical protein